LARNEVILTAHGHSFGVPMARDQGEAAVPKPDRPHGLAQGC